MGDDARHTEQRKARAPTKTQSNKHELSSILDSTPIEAVVDSVTPQAAPAAETEDPLDPWDAVSEPKRPVDPSRVKADGDTGSDLSLFRDIFPEQ